MFRLYQVSRRTPHDAGPARSARRSFTRAPAGKPRAGRRAASGVPRRDACLSPRTDADLIVRQRPAAGTTLGRRSLPVAAAQGDDGGDDGGKALHRHAAACPAHRPVAASPLGEPCGAAGASVSPHSCAGTCVGRACNLRDRLARTPSTSTASVRLCQVVNQNEQYRLPTQLYARCAGANLVRNLPAQSGWIASSAEMHNAYIDGSRTDVQDDASSRHRQGHLPTLSH
jgi:hypothetical protein